MIALICFVLAVLVSAFKSKSRLEAENAVLRHQLIVLRRKVRGRAHLTNNDRWFFVQMYRWFPSILKVVTIIEPETLVRWHRVGFRRYWRWKSRQRGGRPPTEKELRGLIRQTSMENLLWGAPRIHGELKLGFELAQSSVARYMLKRRGPPSQGWRTFLRNHAPDIAAMDLFVVPTIGLKIIYGFVIVRLNRRYGSNVSDASGCQHLGSERNRGARFLSQFREISCKSVPRRRREFITTLTHVY